MLSRHLTKRGEGQVSLVVIREGGSGEIEVELPERYSIDGKLASALKAVPGIVEVELV